MFTMKKLTVKILRLFMPGLYKTILSGTDSHVLRRIMWRLEPVLAKMDLLLLQRYVFPAFTRFLPVAEFRSNLDHSSSSSTEKPIVTCRGLQGSRADATRTYITLIHLIAAVDVMQASSGDPVYDSLYYLANVVLSYLPQCSIDFIIRR